MIFKSTLPLLLLALALTGCESSTAVPTATKPSHEDDEHHDHDHEHHDDDHDHHHDHHGHGHHHHHHSHEHFRPGSTEGMVLHIGAFHLEVVEPEIGRVELKFTDEDAKTPLQTDGTDWKAYVSYADWILSNQTKAVEPAEPSSQSEFVMTIAEEARAGGLTVVLPDVPIRGERLHASFELPPLADHDHAHDDHAHDDHAHDDHDHDHEEDAPSEHAHETEKQL